MCGLCDDDPVVRMRNKKNLSAQADRVRRFSHLMDAMARGDITPHSKEASDVSVEVRGVIRVLAEEFL